MEEKIKQYLREPWKHPRPPADEDPQFLYLITYIGELCVQGYRLIENYGDILLFSIMEFQFSENPAEGQSRAARKLPSRFKVMSWQFSSKQIFQSGRYRKQLYGKMLQIGTLLEEVEFCIIYLREHRYSVLPQASLQKNSLPHCQLYFRKIQWIQQKNGCKSLLEKDQGIELHRLVQAFIKGAGEARNRKLMQKIQDQKKFVYDLFKVINTVCYIIGKEVLENDYQTMSVEKWMRKFTEKKFKRFDLLMRNEHKCSIIDWKFTRLDAEEKIKGAGTQKKNEIYYQLARKDYKTDIELKFYCFHERTHNKSYHCFTCAKFEYHIKTINVEEPDIKKSNSKAEQLSLSQVVIEDSLVDLIPDAPGQKVQANQTVVISLDSQIEEAKEQSHSASQPKNKQQQKTLLQNSPVSQAEGQKQKNQRLLQEFLLTNKRKNKSQKLRSKGVPENCEVFEILSD